jgi:alpha-D-xyloside xylohydrolase
MRWFEQTALSAVMQIGTSSNTVAWELAENGFDETVLDAYRRYTRMHLRLWPYIWTYVERIRDDGRPIARALGLAHPELGEHPDDTYLLGDHLLVAPVVEAGATSREVSFPAGGWIDWWTGNRYQGPQHETVEAPLDVLPLFLREGGIVPMLRPTIDSLSPTTEPNRVDSYATSAGVLYVRVTEGPSSRFVLFDGTVIRHEGTLDEIALSVEQGDEFRSGTLFEVIGYAGTPSRVTDGTSSVDRVDSPAELESSAAGWTSDGRTVHVKVPAGAHDVRISR